MASQSSMLNDFVGLPVVISDWDAMTTASTPPSVRQQHSRQSSRASTSSTTSVTSPSSTANNIVAQGQQWSTGFNSFTEDLWSRMTSGMKKKLREAAVEVLKKTDEHCPEAVGERMEWMYDGDARFLD
ncbi:hypothetical protein B0A48_17185 [Cryoendolithus antarcticus]|uniref:Uncharacterized protein n=1 Tax=Cryoendolithus antarcticus TaxID=1507870 RepID=A0A1V8SD74_9PEZI|nr:hypothetical protein B0A48_17185 [Cryoendolithus antarcticus]